MLDVNDNKPIFGQRVYHVSVGENVQLNPPATILQVSAIDADDGANGEVKYTIVSKDNTLFQLDPTTGILYAGTSLKGMGGKFGHRKRVLGFAAARWRNYAPHCRFA